MTINSIWSLCENTPYHIWQDLNSSVPFAINKNVNAYMSYCICVCICVCIRVCVCVQYMHASLDTVFAYVCQVCLYLVCALACICTCCIHGCYMSFEFHVLPFSGSVWSLSVSFCVMQIGLSTQAGVMLPRSMTWPHSPPSWQSPGSCYSTCLGGMGVGGVHRSNIRWSWYWDKLHVYCCYSSMS